MSYNTFAPIVTNGIILYLDAANVKSYSTFSGATWSDIVGQYHGSLVNSTTFSYSNSGSFLFDGVDDAVSIPTFLLNDSVTKTFNLWVKHTSTSATSFIFADMGFAADRGWAIITEMNSGQILFGGSNNGSDVNLIYRRTTNASLTHSVWTNISIIYNPSSTTASFYKDGVLLNHDGSVIYSSYNNSSTLTRIGGYGSPVSGEFTGLISSVSVYNRALSSDEILQNYNALKNRFI